MKNKVKEMEDEAEKLRQAQEAGPGGVPLSASLGTAPSVGAAASAGVAAAVAGAAIAPAPPASTAAAAPPSAVVGAAAGDGAVNEMALSASSSMSSARGDRKLTSGVCSWVSAPLEPSGAPVDAADSAPLPPCNVGI